MWFGRGTRLLRIFPPAPPKAPIATCDANDPSRESRDGYRHRDFDTRAGTIELAIPTLRQGSYFPEWPLARRARAERALTSVVATCYLLGSARTGA